MYLLTQVKESDGVVEFQLVSGSDILLSISMPYLQFRMNIHGKDAVGNDYRLYTRGAFWWEKNRFLKNGKLTSFVKRKGYDLIYLSKDIRVDGWGNIVINGSEMIPPAADLTKGGRTYKFELNDNSDPITASFLLIAQYALMRMRPRNAPGF